ncbi:MAG: acyltransferase [Rhodospirillales bacterium]|nr:acyltransferase [Acetobacter sp.]
MAQQDRYYRPELDALRLLAFAFVFFFHVHDLLGSTALPHMLDQFATIGAFGVPVFFLLSAFLITELLERERARFGTIRVRDFYVRRALRIWPLYFSAFYGLAVLEHFVPHTGPHGIGCFAAFTAFLGNAWICHYGWIASSVDPLWSISVEEQFYLVIPMLLLLAGRRVVQWVCLGLLFTSYVVLANYAAHPVAEDNGQWTNSFVQFQFFAAGTLLSLRLRGRLLQWRAAARAAAAVLGVALWMVALLVFDVRSWASHASVARAVAGWGCVLAGTILLFAAAFGMNARRIPGWVAYLGRITFGLYVFHSLMLFLVFEVFGAQFRSMLALARLSGWATLIGAAVAITLTIATAHLSFQYFERPFLRLKQRFAHIRSRDEITV